MTHEGALRLVRAVFHTHGRESPGLNEAGFGGLMLPDADILFEYDTVGQLVCRAHLLTLDLTAAELEALRQEEGRQPKRRRALRAHAGEQRDVLDAYIPRNRAGGGLRRSNRRIDEGRPPLAARGSARRHGTLARRKAGSVRGLRSDGQPTVSAWTQVQGLSIGFAISLLAFLSACFGPPRVDPVDRLLVTSGLAVKAIAVSPNGRLLASSASLYSIPAGTKVESQLEIWDLGSRRRLHLLRASEIVEGLVFDPDGSKLYSGGKDRQIRIWDVKTGVQLATIEDVDVVTWVAVTPDGRTLLTYGEADGWSKDRSTRMWDLRLRKLLQRFAPDEYEMDANALSPDGQTLVRGTSGPRIDIFDLPSGQRLHRLNSFGESAGIAVALAGERLVAGTSTGVIEVWELKSARSLWHVEGAHRLPIQGAGVLAIAITPDERLLASSGLDGTVQLWDVRTGKALMILSELSRWSLFMNANRQPHADTISFTPKGDLLLTGHSDGQIRIWSVPNVP